MKRLALIGAVATLTACGPSGPAESQPTVTAAELVALSPNVEQLRQAGAGATGGDPTKGRRLFGQCSVCHAIDGITVMAGPNLAGIWGREVASQPGFGYSDALQAAEFRWSEAAMNAWIAQPLRLVPGSQMSFAGLFAGGDRRDLLAYMLSEPAFFPKAAE